MSAADNGLEGGPERDGAHSQDTGKRRYRRWTEKDAKRWKEDFESGKSILEVAAADNVDPKIVSQWLHRLGVEVHQGRHRVEQLPLKISPELVELLGKGPDYVLKVLDERVWGLTATENGTEQLSKFCKFLELHRKGVGVKAIAKDQDIHRSTIAKWRDRLDQPYLVKAAETVLHFKTIPGSKVLPLQLHAGGNTQAKWIQVPTSVNHYSDILNVVDELSPTAQSYQLGTKFGLPES